MKNIILMVGLFAIAGPVFANSQEHPVCMQETLRETVLSNDFEKVEEVVKYCDGTLINAVLNKDGDTALILATRKGYVEVFMALLEHEEINVNIQNEDKKTALILSSQIDSPGTPREEKEREVEKDREIFSILLAHSKTDINIQDRRGDTALIHLARGEYREPVVRIEDIKALVRREDIDINIRNGVGRSALDEAIARELPWLDSTEIIEALLEHDEIEADHALVWAARRGRLETLEDLLKLGNINVNATDAAGITALNQAATWGHVEIVKALLKHRKIDVNFQDSYNHTALIWAAFFGHAHIAREIVDYLLEHKKAGINTQNNQGNTALMTAVMEGERKMVNILLEHDEIDVNTQNRQGDTALIMASKEGSFKIVEALLENKYIDVNIHNKHYETALDWATKNRHLSIVEILREKGAL